MCAIRSIASIVARPHPRRRRADADPLAYRFCRFSADRRGGDGGASSNRAGIFRF